MFGRVVAIDRASVTIDDFDYFGGDAAAQAYFEDTGQIGGPPNPVWLRDRNTSRTLVLGGSVSVEVIGLDVAGNPSPIPYDLDRLVAAVEHPEVSGLYWSPYFWFDTRDGVVTRIEEPYLP